MPRLLTAERISGALAAGFALALIALDIVGASGWDWQRWPHSARERAGPQVGADEIRDYVEFIHVIDGDLEIITGIAFESSHNRRITKQWCYSEPTSRTQGETIYRLELARIYRNQASGPVSFHPETLRRFGLTEAEAKALTSSKCRFQPMED